MHIGIIAKASKLCNLRCTYCYEMPDLDNPARMSLEQVETMYRNLLEYFADWSNPSEANFLEFVWHGGEPFAQPISYWEAVLDLQDKVFGEAFRAHSIRNCIQSNLTLLTERHLLLLRRFHVGFSYDVANELRITAGGKPMAEAVEKKVEWLQSEGVEIAGIAVISRTNIDQPERVASYFLDRGIPFRSLNIYEGKGELAAARDAALPFDRYLEFFKKLWLMPAMQKGMQDGLWLDPLSTFTGILNRFRKQQELKVSEEGCAHREWLLAVNTNGDVYSPGDCYNPDFRYGNIFQQPLDEVLHLSEGRRRRIERTLERYRECCQGCRFFRKGCDGTHVSHATPEDAQEYRANGGCYYRSLGDWVQATSPPEQQPLESLYLNLTYRCNSDCLFCAADVRYKENPRNMSVEEVTALLSNKRFRRIELSGGEPTIHPKIVDIVRLCRRHSEMIALLTHGRQFQNLPFTRRILEAGANFIVIPLYGATAGQHDRVTNAPGSFAQTIKGFQNLQTLETEFPFWVELKLLYTRAMSSSNRDVYRVARSRFPNAFHQISLCPLIYSQSTLDYRGDYACRFSDIQEDLFSLAQEILEDGSHTLRMGEFPPCFFESQDLLSVAHPGLDKPAPPLLTQAYADEHHTKGLSITADPRGFNGGVVGSALLDCCRKCRHQPYCSGLRSPYFSSAYLEQYGESEFRPATA